MPKFIEETRESINYWNQKFAEVRLSEQSNIDMWKAHEELIDALDEMRWHLEAELLSRVIESRWRLFGEWYVPYGQYPDSIIAYATAKVADLNFGTITALGTDAWMNLPRELRDKPIKEMKSL
jgi:hypothetical protein